MKTPRLHPLTLTVAAALLLTGGLARSQNPQVTCTQTIRLTEPAGIARTQAPVEATRRFERESLNDSTAIRLFRKDDSQRTPVTFQVLSVEPQNAPNSFAPVPQTLVRIVFLADVPAHATVTYEIALEGPAAAVGGDTPQLRVDGQGVGLSIDTGPVLFELDKLSGQLLTFTPKSVANERLVFVQEAERGPKPFHRNPDVWAPPAIWGHTSDRNAPVPFEAGKHNTDQPPASNDKQHPFFYREWKGPLACRITRWGKMPFVPGVAENSL